MISKFNINCNDNQCIFSGIINKNDMIHKSLFINNKEYFKLMDHQSNNSKYVGQTMCTTVLIRNGSDTNRVETLTPGSRKTWNSDSISNLVPGSYKIIIHMRVNSEITWTPSGSDVNIEFYVQRRIENGEIGDIIGSYKLTSSRLGADWHDKSFTIETDKFDINESVPFTGFNIYMVDNSSRNTACFFNICSKDNQVWSAVYIKSYKIEMCG